MENNNDAFYLLNTTRMLKREIPVIILILFIITLSTFCVLSHTADLRTKICMATVFPFMAIYFILHEYVTVKY
jgi:uncharacterized membrane protein